MSFFSLSFLLYLMKNQVNVVKIIRTYKKYANGILQKGGFTIIANEEASPVHVPLSLEACTRRVYFPDGNFV